MASPPPAAGRGAGAPAARRRGLGRSSARSWLVAGGPAGNEQLTAMAGLLLIALLAVIGVTILRKSQLMWVHLFVGALLAGPVALKLASTGYRFARYYTRDAAYRLKGPPELPLRLLAPGVVVTTAVVFASGFVLLFDGPSHRGQWVTIHKLSFILWLGFTGLHVLGHLPRMPASLRAARAARAEHDAIDGLPRGEGGRWLAFAGMVVAGVVLAIVLIPHFGAWTAPGALGEEAH